MISSAVAIPEQEPEQRPPSPPLKRRQSSTFLDSNKRPRLDTQGSNEDVAQPVSADATSPPSKKRSAVGVGAAEEKKRGQRLFGALLGTLSQKSARPAHKKRDEIEQRQRERLRKDTEEREEERRRKRDELDKARRVEQKVWETESTRIRHRNMRAMAGFLQTKTQPALFYKPWELREKEEDLIKRQIKEVEEKIRDELGQDRKSPRPTDQDDQVMPDVSKKADEDVKSRHSSPDVAMSNGEQQEPGKDEADAAKAGPEQPDLALDAKPTDDDKPKEDEHAGEELVEGQEDDVIY